ncbi:unnamed protein product [Closterium sp. NIES-65]|nr:unnamed protein product [Closterium sp. NIES-65]
MLTFDAEGRAVDFEVWVDVLQLFLQSDRKDGLSQFDFTSGASAAPAANAESTFPSQWTTRDAAPRLAVRSHLPSTEHAHFSQYKSAKTLYNAVVARYSSLATAALSCLMMPYLFPDLGAFPTVADLITRLPNSLRSVRDHFLSVCPTTLTVDLLEEHLLAPEKSIVAVKASCGDPRAPFYEGCSPAPLLPYVASSAAVDLVGTESVGAASAHSGRRRNDKDKGGKGAEELAGAVVVAVEAAEGVGLAVGVVAGVEASVAAVEAEVAAAVAVGAEMAAVAAVGAAAVELVGVALCSGEASVVVSANSSTLVRPRHPSSFVSGTLRISGVGVLVLVPMYCILATALVSRAAARTPPSAASAA